MYELPTVVSVVLFVLAKPLLFFLGVSRIIGVVVPIESERRSEMGVDVIGTPLKADYLGPRKFRE